MERNELEETSVRFPCRPGWSELSARLDQRGPRLAPHLCDPPASQLALFSRTKRCPWYDPRRIQDRTFFQRLATIPTPLHEMFLVLQSRRWTLFQVSA